MAARPQSDCEAQACRCGALVLGAGRSGKSAAALLERAGAAVTVLDGDDAWPREGAAGRLAVASPGIPPDHPWRRAAAAEGVRTVSELQLGAETWLAAGGRMLAVTGSKGKSSVVKFVADALSLAGRPAVPCGNYGVPVCEVCMEHLPRAAGGSCLPWLVVEVSSFQLETTELPRDAFAAAAILNLQEDHLDRHGSVAEYHALKRRLLGFSAVPLDFSGVSADGVSAGDAAIFAGSYFGNRVLSPNAAAAAALLRAAGLDDAAIARAAAAFEPLPHRMALVCERGGVRFVDDSKATSVEALCAGVAMAAASSGAPGGKCRLIAGGLGKDDDPKKAIIPLRNGAGKVYLIGRCADRFYDAWSKAVPCEKCGTLEAAVAAARRDAVPGETVLLSPGAASFDQFENYSVRGDAFAALAKEG